MDKTVRIWDVESGKLLQTLPPQPDSIRCLAYEPKKKLLAWALYDGDVTVWDTEKRAKVHSLPGGKYDVSSIAFSPDGLTVASARAPIPPKAPIEPITPENLPADNSKAGGEVVLWSVATGEVVCKFDHPRVSVARFSHDGRSLASGGYDNCVRLWDVKERKLNATLNEFGKEAKIIPNKYVQNLP